MEKGEKGKMILWLKSWNFERMVESGYCRYNYKCAYFKKFIIIRTINIIIIIIKEKYFALVVELWSKSLASLALWNCIDICASRHIRCLMVFKSLSSKSTLVMSAWPMVAIWRLQDHHVAVPEGVVGLFGNLARETVCQNPMFALPKSGFLQKIFEEMGHIY